MAKAAEILSLGIDVGSTTVKAVVLSKEGKTLYGSYLRHYSKVKETVESELHIIKERFPNASFHVYITGSAGLGLSERSHIPFIQEVQSAFHAIKTLYPQVDCAIELGGEDAKILFLTGGVEERMNGQCAGGTGAFIDQMATLLNIDVTALHGYAEKAEKSYPIASRCGVFAKSDIQSLLNQGASKEDICLSIYYAIADQTIAGLAQGRDIQGNILFLGGPLSFAPLLRKAFQKRLNLTDEQCLCPEEANIFMAKGAAIFAAKDPASYSIDELIEKVASAEMTGVALRGDPLFKDQEDFDAFVSAHKDFDIAYGDLASYSGPAYLGIDAGSTTTKLVLLGKDKQILYSHYAPNKGLPVDCLRTELEKIYSSAHPSMRIVSSAVTGYGEDLIRAALGVDYGLVETMAHFRAAKHYAKDVDFIIDIGGQDIKCFRIQNGAIDSIMLNEACSSGCGSFLSSFATSLGYGVEEFAKLGYFSKNPVELGSRCTVFMNSSVKQAQREGASVEDISAGLSRSVVKNALYKVIRVRNTEELGKTIVCQGGTFLNNAVLRAFEQEVGRPVIRPSIAGIMGAFGAALYAMEQPPRGRLLGKEELSSFSYKQTHTTCHACTAHCPLSILTFPSGKRFIAGNKCEKPEGRKVSSDELDMHAYKRSLLQSRLPAPTPSKAKVGLPMALAMYEQLPLWETFFVSLGFEVAVSPFSTRKLYRAGQRSIPSDTACYPAKIMHGHIADLLDQGVDFIFYPSESYNVNEHRGDNNFNCPVVAYYGELLRQNEPRLNKDNFLDPFLELGAFPKAVESLYGCLGKRFNLSKGEIKKALRKGLQAYLEYRSKVKKKGAEILQKAKEEGKLTIVLVGRPYHIDPEISHGIDKLLDSLGCAVITEDAISFPKERTKVAVLNQWTFHTRLYDTAKYVGSHPEMELVQLVSFGCGLDAITTDEVRSILQDQGRLYTQIKIDEINNLGAVKIRLRSLLSAVEERKAHE